MINTNVICSFCLPLLSLLINPCCRRASYAKTTGVESGFLWEYTAVNFKFERPHLHVSRYLKRRRVFSPFSEKLRPQVAYLNRFRPSTRKRKYDNIPWHALYAVSHHRIWRPPLQSASVHTKTVSVPGDRFRKPFEIHLLNNIRIHVDVGSLRYVLKASPRVAWRTRKTSLWETVWTTRHKIF